MMKMANYLALFSSALFICSYMFQTTQSNDHTRNGFSLRLIGRGSLASPSNQSAYLTTEEDIDRLIDLAGDRVEYFEHLAGDNSSQSTNVTIRPPILFPRKLKCFLVEVGIGTFSAGTHHHKTYYLAMDTASSLIWTQCEGCNPCFPQRNPYFPRSESSTYHVLPCNQCPEDTVCEHDHCRVQKSYFDGAQIRGIGATDTFTYAANNGIFLSTPNIRFTCVTWTKDFIEESDTENIASGVLGMNRDPSSFISQIGMDFGGRFSYCLIPVDFTGQDPPMFLRFGVDIRPLHGYQTHILQGPRHQYYLDLQDISVGSERLNLNPNVFQITGSSGGCIIDSGSTFSTLISAAYVEFERVLIREIEARNPEITKTSSTRKLCYKKPGPRARTEFPTITFHFASEAYFVVQPEEYMSGVRRRDAQNYCLTIISSDFITLLGSFQQANHRIIYDIVNSQLSFAPANCLDDN